MKASKFSEAQLAFVLKQADEGNTVAEVCRTAGIGPFQHLLRNYLSGSGRLRFTTGGRNMRV